MRIAIYYPWICLKGGVERTILEMVKDKSNDYTIFTNNFNKNATFKEFKKLHVIVLNKIPDRSSYISNFLSALIIFFQKIDLSKFDLFIVHSEGLADLITFRNRSIPTVLFCYTPLRPVFDKYHMNYLCKGKGIIKKMLIRLLSKIFSLIDIRLWKKLRHVVFISIESLGRAKRGHLLGKWANPVVIHPGVNWGKIKVSQTFDNFFLLPGRITWSKNIELAIDAFSIFRNRFKGKPNFELVIAGGVDKKNLRYFNKLKSSVDKNKNIRFVKNPSEDDLDRLYSNCYVTLATAKHEDWGLTPIEGNAHGKAALCVNSGGYKESQINNKTGYLLKDSSEEFSKIMVKLAADFNLIQRLGKYSRISSEKFSWDNFRLDFKKYINSIIPS